jgi:molybdopterin converting factor small subunit
MEENKQNQEQFEGLDIDDINPISNLSDENEEDLIDIPEVDSENVDSNHSVDIKEEGDTKTSGGNEVSEVYKLFAKALKEEGVVEDFSEEEFDVSNPTESLKGIISKTINKHVERYLSQFPEELKDLAEAVKEGIPIDSLKELKKEELKYSTIDPEELEYDDDLQKRIVKEYLTLKGIDAEKSDKLVSKMSEEDLYDEAKEALSELKEYYKKQQEDEKLRLKKQREIQEKQLSEFYNSLVQKVKETDEVIPGHKLNPDLKEKVLAIMTQPFTTDENGNPVNYVMAKRAENPIDFDLRLSYLVYITDGLKNFDKLINIKKSDVYKEFEEKIKQTPTSPVGKTRSSSISNNRDIDDILKSLDKI